MLQFQRDLIELYDPAKAGRYPPMTIVTSRKTPTVRGILVTSREDIAREGYERLLWAEGAHALGLYLPKAKRETDQAR